MNIEKLEISSNFDTSLVTNMYGVFSHCESLTSVNLEKFYSISEFKKQMLDYFELSRNNLEKKIHLVTNEINSIKKENVFLQNKFKDLLSKLSYNDETLTSSFLTDIQNKTISPNNYFSK